MSHGGWLPESWWLVALAHGGWPPLLMVAGCPSQQQALPTPPTSGGLHLTVMYTALLADERGTGGS